MSVKNLQVQFGNHKVLNNVSFSLKKGEILGLIGPNGCGKTTMLNAISGFVPLKSGEIYHSNTKVSCMPAHLRSKKYFGRTFQSVGVFKNMTVEENLIMALEREKKLPWWWMFSKKNKDGMNELVDELLSQVHLVPYKKEKAGILSGGQLRLLELLKLRVMKRDILLIDEPTAGVSPKLREHLSEMIQDLAQSESEGIIIVEHDMKFLFSLVSRVIVMVEGEIYMEGQPNKIQNDPKLRELYFGK